jgi:hypothetical protein
LSKEVKFDLNQAFVTSNFLVRQQDKLAVSRGDIAQGLIQIYKALGGGWEIRLNGPDVIQKAEPILAPAPPKDLPPMDARFGSPVPVAPLLSYPVSQTAVVPASGRDARRE